MDLCQDRLQWLKMEVWESLMQRGRVEMPMGDCAATTSKAYLRGGIEGRCHDMRHLAKRVGPPGDRVEQTGGAVHQHQPHQLGNVVGKDVIARLLALAAQRDLAVLGG